MNKTNKSLLPVLRMASTISTQQKYMVVDSHKLGSVKSLKISKSLVNKLSLPLKFSLPAILISTLRCRQIESISDKVFKNP